MIVVAPYAKAGYISHRQYEFGSIVRFVEDNWNFRAPWDDGTLPRLISSTISSISTSSRESFLTQYAQAYFLHQRPSGQPVDDEVAVSH